MNIKQLVEKNRFLPKKGQKYYAIKEDGSVGHTILHVEPDHYNVRGANTLNCFKDRESAERVAEVMFLIRLVLNVCDKESLDWKNVLWKLLNGWVVDEVPEEVGVKLMKL